MLRNQPRTKVEITLDFGVNPSALTDTCPKGKISSSPFTKKLSTMTLESSTNGQLSPPHSDHEDHHFNDFSNQTAATIPYTPPQLNAAHAYVSRLLDLVDNLLMSSQAYGDPEEYEMQQHQAYFDHDVSLGAALTLENN